MPRVKTPAKTSERLAVLEERVNTMLEVKADVKTILTEVQAVKLHLVNCPTFDDLKPLKTDIQDLKDTRNEIRAGWKTLAVAGSVVSACSGLVGAVLSRWFHSGPNNG
jgi:hypothetical protein